MRVRLDNGALVCASGGFHKEENPGNLFDGSRYTKWYSWRKPELEKTHNADLADTKHWLTYSPPRHFRLAGYTFTLGNDCPERDPKAWFLEGRQAGEPWVVIDKQDDSPLEGIGRRRDVKFSIASGIISEVRFRFMEPSNDTIQLTSILFEEASLMATAVISAGAAGDDTFEVRCLGLGGNEIAMLKRVGGDESMQNVRGELALQLHIPTANLHLVTPGGHVLDDSFASLEEVSHV